MNWIDNFFFYDANNKESKKLNKIDIILITVVTFLSIILISQHIYWNKLQTENVSYDNTFVENDNMNDAFYCDELNLYQVM